MGQSNRMLLVLDLDETLIHATEQPLDRPPDFKAGPYSVYRRPHLADFLTACADLFDLAFWSSASSAYVALVVPAILPPGVEPVFAWSWNECVKRLDAEMLEDVFIKDLRKVRRRGYHLARVLAVDDTPGKLQRHHGNAVYVHPFYSDPADAELPLLARYLAKLADVPDVRRLEKRGWRESVRNQA